MFILKYKNFFFALSGLLVLASLVAIGMWGLNPSVDFTGGSIVSVRFADARPTGPELTTTLEKAGFAGAVVRDSAEGGVLIRTKTLSEGDRTTLLTALSGEGRYKPEIERLSSVGPTVGQELRRKTWIAIALVMLMIILYVAFTFRKVSEPISSWVYGLIAILALLHDITIPTGVFALLGKTAGLEADTLFIVALLTILGLSVNDTIVVFDRIREHLRRNKEHHTKEGFTETVGKSLEETYVRSLNTSLTVILVLLVLFFLGGSVIHSFVLTLLIGMVVGTYSSIFIASPLLVVIANRKLQNLK
ncbi:protein translocase subunit SecF [Candidatus Campbellbacteria bacterium]|nr:MAG: protein translocase subunit SecF [Candidatus Campbellbacteria bacterium]